MLNLAITPAEKNELTRALCNYAHLMESGLYMCQPKEREERQKRMQTIVTLQNKLDEIYK